MSTDVEIKRLPNSFFRGNPLKELSTATLMYFSITTRMSDKLEQMIDDKVAPEIKADRKEKLLQERQHIEQTDDPTALVEIMRKGTIFSTSAWSATKSLRIMSKPCLWC